MYVKQLSVFLENAPGKLAQFTQVLAEKGIDLVSLSIADTADYGILRFIVADWEKAARLIEEAGYTVRVDDVLAIDVPDRPGGLSEVLAQLSNFGIEINYLYSFAQQGKSNALIVFRVEDSEKTAKILSDHGVKCVSHEEVSAL